MKTVLVTGGLGYIGSHTAVDLIARGHRVVLADNLNNTRAEVLDGIEAISGVRTEWVHVDLADRSATEAFLAGRHFDGIIHFAAHKAVGGERRRAHRLLPQQLRFAAQPTGLPARPPRVRTHF